MPLAGLTKKWRNIRTYDHSLTQCDEAAVRLRDARLISGHRFLRLDFSAIWIYPVRSAPMATSSVRVLAPVHRSFQAEKRFPAKAAADRQIILLRSFSIPSVFAYLSPRYDTLFGDHCKENRTNRRVAVGSR